MEALVGEKRHELIEMVSDVDDQLAEAFLADEPISSSDLEEAIRRATVARKFVPVFMGSAFKNKIQWCFFIWDWRQFRISSILVVMALCNSCLVHFWHPDGVQPLLDGVLSYLLCPTEVANYALDQNNNEEKVLLNGSPTGPLVALAFKLEEG